MAGRDIGALQRVLSVGALQAPEPVSVTETQVVSATAGVGPTGEDAPIPFIILTLTLAASATASVDSTQFASAVQTQQARAVASAEDGFVVSALQEESVQATASAQAGVFLIQQGEQVQATASTDSTAFVGFDLTHFVQATASADDGQPIGGQVQTQAVEATASTIAGVKSGGATAAQDLYESMHNRIRSRVATQLSGVSHLVFDNEREATTADSIWCDVAVVDEDTEARSYGGGQRIFRKRGTLRITVYGPLQRGDAAMLSVADDIRAGFSRVVAERVHYGPTSVGDLRRVDQRFQLVAETPFYLDDRMTRPDNVGNWQLVDREAAFNSIRSRFDLYFGSNGIDQTQTVVYDNAPTKPPEDEQWVMFSIQTGSTEEIGAGVNAWARTTGIATAMICTPLGTGDQRPLALADKIAPRFRSLTDNGVVYETPYVVTAGRREQWFQTNVIIRFRLEEILP